MPDFDAVFLAYGTLGDQSLEQSSPSVAVADLNTNLVSAVSLLTHAANELECKRTGCIAVITSVAGDRGRRSNYVYGAAKAGLTTFLQGLRSRLYPAGVRVLTIKPGPVDTPMTAHLKKSAMFASPTTVARQISREILHGKRDVLYTPAYWRLVMALIRAIPESFAKRLDF